MLASERYHWLGTLPEPLQFEHFTWPLAPQLRHSAFRPVPLHAEQVTEILPVEHLQDCWRDPPHPQHLSKVSENHPFFLKICPEPWQVVHVIDFDPLHAGQALLTFPLPLHLEH